ncbi:hypothetical protein GCM10009760_49690 [Kitasatospora kazusensis]|uniref:Uncharacterized protein n=1 Tax=Kitasatospora kazusensis TaxID=407974 RepID=A0ABN3A3R6_9ACTN
MLERDVSQAREPGPGLSEGCLLPVAGQQRLAAGGQQGRQDPDGAARFEGAAVVAPGEDGEGEGVLALLVPAATGLAGGRTCG